MPHRITKSQGLEESVCACSRCVSMCNAQPCLPTPEEAAQLRLKYPDKMVEYAIRYRIPPSKKWQSVQVCGPKILGLKGRTELDRGRCVFLNIGDGCDLHQKGEKPLEGRLANHNVHQGAAMFAALSQWVSS